MVGWSPPYGAERETSALTKNKSFLLLFFKKEALS
jgi:hypothetical protein